MPAEELCGNQVLERCDSTNDLARRLGENGAPHGTWISARVQEKGRGRLGRQWQSREGNLFLSIVVRPAERALWTWVPLAAALGIAGALLELYPDLPIRVKWPNDLWIEGRKLAGILCEAVGNREDSFIVVGIGLNCAVAPEGLDQATASLSAALGRPVVADDVRAAVVRHVLERMRLEPSWITTSYDRLAALPPGTPITWSNGQEKGIVIGLGASGELRVSKGEGKRISLFAEDVSVRPL